MNKCKKKRITPQTLLKQHIKKPQQNLLSSPVSSNSEVLSPSKQKDDEIESDIMNELDRYHATKGEKRDIEGLTASIISSATNTTPRCVSSIDQEHFEKIKSLEQELSNQKLLNHYTELRLKKKENECKDIQKSEKTAQKKIRELMSEISSISDKNANLMKYCESKVAECRIEYEKITKKSFDTIQKKKELEIEVINLTKKLSENIMYKTECTKLRGNISNYKSQIREINKKIAIYEKEMKTLKNTIETQKYRLNDGSKHFNKISDDLIMYKNENKRIKQIIFKYKDKMNELEIFNDELIEENKDIKIEIDKLSKQLKQQTMIKNEIIDIQQQLTSNNNKKSPILISSSSHGQTINIEENNDIESTEKIHDDNNKDENTVNVE